MGRAGKLLVALVVAAATGAGVGWLATRSNGTPAPVVARGEGLLDAGRGIIWAQVSADIYRSINDGAHWRTVLTDVDPRGLYGCPCSWKADFLGSEDAWVARRAYPRASTDLVRVWHSTDGGAHWIAGRIVADLPSSLDNELGYSISFVTPKVGYLLGSGLHNESEGNDYVALLWRSDDGGRSWTRVKASGLPLSGGTWSADCAMEDYLTVDFATPLHGWISGGACPGRSTPLYETTDGGLQWHITDLAPPPGGWPAGGVPQSAAPVVTASSVVVDEVTTRLAGLVVEETGPSGRFTATGTLETGQLGRVAALDVLDANRLVLPVSGGLYESDDAGRNWRFVSDGLDLAALGLLSLHSSGAGLTGVIASALPLATSGGTGLLTGPVALRTSDGGRSFTATGTLAGFPSNPHAPYDLVGFRSATTGVVAGSAGIAETSDGGVSFHSVLSAGMPITSLDVPRDGTAVALSRDEMLVSSGRRWRQADEPRLGQLSSAAFAGSSTAYGAVCSTVLGSTIGGQLVTSTDDGASWRPAKLPPDVGCPDIVGVPDGEARTPGNVCVAKPTTLFALGGSGMTVLRESEPWLPGKAPEATLYESTDAARSWHAVGLVPGTNIVGCTTTDLWTELSDGATIRSSAIYLSVDGGRRFCTSLRTSSSGGSAYVMPAAACGSVPTILGEAAVLVPVTPGSSLAFSTCLVCLDHQPFRTVRFLHSASNRWSSPVTLAGVASLYGASFPGSDAGYALATPSAGSVEGVQGVSPTSVLEQSKDGGVHWSRRATFG